MPVSNATNRFSDRVENYVRYRPGYPPQVLETLKQECGLKREHRIADDVADRKDVRDIRAHLLVGGNKAAIGDADAGRLGVYLLAVR